jgi:hypothetical protein
LDDGSTKRVSTNPQANYQYPQGAISLMRAKSGKRGCG